MAELTVNQRNIQRLEQAIADKKLVVTFEDYRQVHYPSVTVQKKDLRNLKRIEENELLTCREAARILGYDVEVVRRYVRKGLYDKFIVRIPPYDAPRFVRRELEKHVRVAGR